MALRVVLAVVLTLTLLAVALPAVDDARTARTATALDTASDRVRATGERLRATSDPVTGGTAARRVVSLDLPTRGWGARAGRLRLRDGHVAWRVGDGRWHTEHVPWLVAPDGVLVVYDSVRLTLSHRLREGRSVVVVVQRGFKSEAGTTAGYDPARTSSWRHRYRLSMYDHLRR